MNRKMKILVLSRGYPSEKYPMNGIFEFDQAKALASLGHEVVFGVLDMRSIRRFRKLGNYDFIQEDINVEVISKPVGNIKKTHLQKITNHSAIKLYKKLQAKYGEFDVIHSHFTHIGHAALAIKQEFNVPVVLTEHFSKYMENEVESWLNDLARETFPYVDDVITVSPSLKEVLLNKYGIESNFIPNIVDVESFQYEKKKDHNTYNFISVGLLIPRKRMDLIIHAFNQLYKGNSKYNLTIIGEGPERKNLEHLIDKYDLSDQVTLTGSLKRKEIGKYMKNSDSFVLPSQAETFGVVYIEAMASGLPVIATRCGGPEHFVNDENGILININDQEALQDAMINIVNKTYKREKLSEETKFKYSPKNIAQEISRILEGAINNENK